MQLYSRIAGSLCLNALDMSVILIESWVTHPDRTLMTWIGRFCPWEVKVAHFVTSARTQC